MKENLIKVQIKIKGFHPYYLNRVVLLSLNKLKQWSLDKNIVEKQVFLPKKKKRFTLLRSPHVDKKARDQFEQATSNRLICLKLNATEKTILFIYRFIKYVTRLSAGSSIEVRYKNIQK